MGLSPDATFFDGVLAFCERDCLLSLFPGGLYDGLLNQNCFSAHTQYLICLEASPP